MNTAYISEPDDDDDLDDAPVWEPDEPYDMGGDNPADDYIMTDRELRGEL